MSEYNSRTAVEHGYFPMWRDIRNPARMSAIVCLLRSSGTRSVERRRTLDTSLDGVRQECLKIQESISVAAGGLHVRRRSLQDEFQKLRSRFREGAPHTLEDQQLFLTLAGDVSHASSQLADARLHNGIATTSTLLKLSEPEVLDYETKLDYAVRIREGLREREEIFLPAWTTLTDEYEATVRRLADFVGSSSGRTESPSAEKALLATAEETKLGSPKTENDDQLPHFELCDEFLDSAEYRRIASEIISKSLLPMDEIASLFRVLSDHMDRRHSRLTEWQSTGPHEDWENRWLSDRLTTINDLTNNARDQMKAMTPPLTNANRQLRIALEHGTPSATEALREFAVVREDQIDRVLPRLKVAMEQAIAGSKEILDFTESVDGQKGVKRKGGFWRRRA
jgi:hypothetical protein